MRTLIPTLGVVAALGLAACGGTSPSPQTNGVPTAVTITHTSNGHRTTTKIRLTTSFKTTSLHQGPIPAVPVAQAACRGLAPLGSGSSGASAMKAKLDPTIAALTKFVAPLLAARKSRHQPKRISQLGAEQSRAASVLTTMRAVSAAAAKYIASPTSSNRSDLAAAVKSEQNTSVAETLSACKIPA